MDSLSTSERPRKRRAINACVNCRTSKVRCDGKRPCQRCEKNDAVCQYHGGVRDENVLRIEKLETEVAELRNAMDTINNQGGLAFAPISSRRIDERNRTRNATEEALITLEQAALWFQRY
jgi:hypothetical protein